MKDWTLWLFETGSVVNLILLFILALNDSRGEPTKLLRRWVIAGMAIILVITLAAGTQVLLRP
jgi:hypothetical protein